MTPSRLFALCLAAVAVGACSNDDELGAAAPTAGMRFINAVGDTGSMDLRVVDIVGDAPQFLDNVFRGVTPYQGVTAGTRRLRLYMTPVRTDTLAGSLVVWDTTFTFVASTNYTVAITGFARAAGGVPLQMLITEDPAGDPAGQIGLRLIHAGSAMGNVDVNTTRRATDTLPDAPQAGNVAYGTVGTYFTTGRDSVAADSLRGIVTAVGTKTPLLVNLKAPSGVAGTTSANPIAGSRVAGSVLTAIVIPAAVAGSQAPAGAATILYLADRRPPMTVP